MYRLYYSPYACSLAPHIVLEELGAPYVLEKVSVNERRTETPEYRAINPRGRVPALRLEDGAVLTEVAAILGYLARRHPEPDLLPAADALLEARCREWMSWLGSSVHIAFGQIWRPERCIGNESQYPEVQASGRRNAEACMADAEGRLRDRPYAAGDRYTVADPYLYVFFRWARHLGIATPDRSPALTRHAGRIEARPAVQRALAQEQAA